MRWRAITTALWWVLTAGTVAQAEEPVKLEGMSLKGNAEQPKVLYIVPWKGREGEPIVIDPPQLRTDNLLSPLERSRFRSRLYYREQRRIGDLAG